MRIPLPLPALLLLFTAIWGRAQLNVAQGKAVTTQYSTSTLNSTWPGGYGPANLTDGNPASFSHPNTMTTTTGFKYDINLGRTYNIDRIRLYNRNDGCCPDRLSNYRLSVLADNGSGAPVTPALWTAVVRSNGTNSGSGGVDEVLAAADPAGTFAGQWVRVENISGAAYSPQVAEVQVLSQDGVTDPNLALFKPVVFRTPANADTTTYTGYPASNLTDGNPATFSHPNTVTAPATPLGHYYQIDLGSDQNLGRIVIYGRTDGCCPEGLSNYRVSLYADSAGQPGAELWTGSLHTDGSTPPVGGADTVTPDMGTGSFHGRFIRVTNLSNIAYNPQIGEIEAYKPPAPLINFFTTSAGNISHGATPGLPASATLSWKVTGATALSINQGIGTVSAPEGTVTVSPLSQTTYTLTATNSTGTSTATLTIAVDAVQLPPRINEIMAENDASAADEDGGKPDWIEIYNPNVFTLSLAGMHLTDSAAEPQKWSFPAGASIPGSGYLLVFASGKDRRVAGAPLHTNFELKKSGEAVFLNAPGGTQTVSKIPADYPATTAYPPQYRDTGYGLNSSGELRYFRPATPGAANVGAGYTSVVDDTSFSVKRGIYATPQTVAITCATPGATIRYTVNGAKPTESTGSVYSSPITVSTNTVIRAAAFLAGAAPSNVDTHTYLFPASVGAQPTMLTTVTGNAVWGPQIPAALQDVPSICLTTANTAAFNNDTEIESSFEWIHNSDPLQHQHANCGVQYFGGAFTNFAKKSFRLYFRSDYGDKKLKANLFGGHEHGYHAVQEFDSLELRNGSHDMNARGFYMSNLFTDQVMSEMGNLSPHGRFIHVYLNGTYWGLYHLRERWNASMHSSYLGGQKEDYESINGNYNVGGWADPGQPFDGDGSAWLNIKSKRANYAQLRSLVDVKDFTDYMVTWMFGNAEDEWRHVSPSSLIGAGSGARFVMNDADGWLSIGPTNTITAWDGNDNNTARGSSLNAGVFTQGRSAGDGPGALLSALYLGGGADYRMQLADRIHASLFNDGPLTPASNQARLDAMCQAIARPFIAEAARWNYRLPADPAGGPESAGDWEDAWQLCRNSWMPGRTNTVLTYFRTAGFYPTLVAPVFAPNGGIVAPGALLTMTAPGAAAGSVIYYTLDGSDPRAPVGATAAGALTYSAPLAININSVVRARTRDAAGNWSALQERFFQLNTSSPCPAGSVVPAELHFNPMGDDDAEFIELLNVSGGAVNLRGCRFTAGVDFAFSEYRDTLLAPGQRLVLVDSEFSHRARYGWDRQIGGIYFDNLSNNGEQLTFMCGATPVFDFTFSEAWHRLADGGGPSLVLIRPATGQNLNDPANWRAGQGSDGTPGLADSGAAFAGNPTADADQDGRTAFVEYALGTSDSVPDSGETITWSGTAGGFAVTHAATADDAILIPEISTDLSAWSGVPNALSNTTEERLPDGRIRATYVPDGVFIAGASRYFVRLRVVSRQ